MSALITVDGSFGEGGGAILRQALGLSAFSGRGVRVVNIRARRPKPGLRAQHLKAVEAVVGVSSARVTGAARGSTEISFRPGTPKSGRFVLNVGTAGSTTLVLQAVLVPCLCDNGEYVLEITGGTDVPWSPPVDYLRMVTFPVLRTVSEAEIMLVRRGYYPKGGGRIRARLRGRTEPTARILASDRGRHLAIQGISHAADSLRGRRVAERQADAAERALKPLGLPVEFDAHYAAADSPGSGITLWTVTDGAPPIGCSALGARGKPAETVGAEAAQLLRKELASGAVVDRYLADQLVPFLAISGGSFRTSAITGHCRSNMYVAERILGARFEVAGLQVTAHAEV